jgi:tetratricopeptide (TPR) repeat protein
VGDKRSLVEIARAVGVAHVVTARLAPDADSGHVRVRAALVRARDETEVWSETVQIDLADIRAGEARLARVVGDGLRAVIGSNSSPAQLSRESPEVFELLLSAGGGDGGVFGWSAERAARADSLLRRAIALDSKATEALARLGLLRAARLWRPMPPRKFESALDSARQPTRRALVLDSMNVTANIAMAFIGMADARLDETESRARRVLALHAEHADALEMLGSVALCAGKYQEARHYFSRALAADPLNPDHAASLGITELVGFGRVESARDLETRTLELWEARGSRAEAGARVLSRELALGAPFAEVRARAAEERARRPFSWAGAATFGASEDVEWVLASAEDWQRMDSAFVGSREHLLFRMRRAMADQQWSQARRLAAPV